MPVSALLTAGGYFAREDIWEDKIVTFVLNL